MFSCIFDQFCRWPPGPTFDLFLTNFNFYFGVSGPLARLQFHEARKPWSANRELRGWPLAKKGGAVETGVKRGLEKAPKPWIRRENRAQTLN